MAKYTEEEYREAARIWREENPNVKKIPQTSVIKISSGKEVSIGNRVHHIRRNFEILNDEQKKFWKDYGLFEEKREVYTEEDYKTAARIWREENPNVKMISSFAKIKIPNGKEVPIGKKFSRMRQSIEKLDEEQKEFWKDYGLFNKKNSYTEEEYREAARIWRKENPRAKMIFQTAIIKILNGKEIPLGTKINHMRTNIERLDEEQIKFWKDYGLLEDVRYTEEEYREAARIWRKENPNAKKSLRKL